MSEERLFPAPKSRTLAATLGVLVTAVLMTAAMPAYLPIGLANSIVLPIVLFPVTWLLLFLWVLFDRSMIRAWLVLVGLALGHAALIALGLGAL